MVLGRSVMGTATGSTLDFDGDPLTAPGWATLTVLMPSTDYTVQAMIIGSGNTSYSCPKLELGNAPTQWTPAPEDVQSTISTAQQTADNAATAAGQAQSAADTAQSTATAAQTAASTAQSTANIAKSTADTAKTTADTAKTTADTAKSTADTASSTATAAQSTASMYRSCAIINLDQIRQNLMIYKEKLSSNVEIMAVVKADAYGHGDQIIANVLSEEPQLFRPALYNSVNASAGIL